MKPLVEFLSDMRSHGITLSVSDDRLVCNAPKGAVTAEIRQQLADRKTDILAFLGQTQRTQIAERTAGINRELPLSHSQQRLWFFTQLDPDNPVYNVVISIWLEGNLNRVALERALRSIVERHESLRTGFYEQSGKPHAQIIDTPKWSIDKVSLLHLAPAQAEEEARLLAATVAGKPFRLDSPPLFRASLFDVTSQRALLLLSLHHIVSDGWSLGILSQELTALYQAFATGKISPLSSPSFQYQDYVNWEQDAGRRLAEQQMLYWLEQLSGELPVLELPGDRPRPALQTFRGKRSAVSIEESLAEQIQVLTRATGTTVFMVLLAAFQTLLYRYTGQEDVLVGSSTSNRPRQEFTTQIGFFVNNLVLRGDLSGNPTFAQLLKRTQEIATAAFAHQNVPFERLVEALHPDRALSHNPLVQVMFNFQNLPLPKLRFAGITALLADIDPGIARADINLEVWPESQGYRCDFEYSTDIFDEATIKQMQRHFIRLLTVVVANPETPISSLPLLSPSENIHLIHELNETTIPAPLFETVHAWFKSQADATPQATAVVMGSETLSYFELDERSDRLALLLASKGVKAEVVVGIYLSRSPQMIIAMLAILKAGGAYLPLDPAFPAQRIEFLLADAKVPVLLTESSLVPSLPEINAQTIRVDEALDIAPEMSNTLEFPVANFQSDDLAYLIYTSGSTGTPKGTEITHRSLVNLLASMLREPGMSSLDTLLSVTTLSFDIAGLEIFGPLVCGATLVLASREQAMDPHSLAALLQEHDVTVLQATPSTWRMLVDSGWMGKSDLRMWCGGEALTPDLADSLLKQGQQLWNLYGPTETTIWSAAHRVTAGEDPILIGRPIGNTQFFILDRFQLPVPMGVVGELYIAGEGVARGYWNRKEMTESRFLPNPFSDKTASRMYRTGDLARYRRDGQVQLLGRTDQQIKLRGYRIELNEIEGAIERHPQVLRAVVTLHGKGKSQKLIAYIKQHEEISSAELRASLQQRLPDYMVPSTLVVVDEFPLTPNGKIDRKRLPALPESSTASLATSVVARNQIEELIVRIWSDVLQIGVKSIHDNFFDLGGHSLLLMQVHSRLRSEIDPDLAVVDLFRYPTIESLAAHLEKRQQLHGVASG